MLGPKACVQIIQYLNNSGNYKYLFINIIKLYLVSNLVHIIFTSDIKIFNFFFP